MYQFLVQIYEVFSVLYLQKKISKNNEESLNVQGETTSASASAESSKLNTFDNVDLLEKPQSPKFIINTADLSTVSSPKNVNEILTTCRSIELILSLLLYFTIKNESNERLHCTICECTLKYDFNTGSSFDTLENLPASFSHLKESIKRHIQSSNHISTSALKEKLSTEHKVLYKQSREAAVNCASACYLGYKLRHSYSSYEHFVTEIHMSGGNVGLKNNSKEFSRNFLEHIYDVLRGTFVSFVTDNKLPFGLLADKIKAQKTSYYRRPSVYLGHKQSFDQS